MKNYTPFLQAKPIWTEDDEKYTLLGLYTALPDSAELKLRIAASGPYRIFINGAFFYCGPARCAHGFFRVDEIALPPSSRHVAIEVMNYRVGAFSVLRQEGFVQAEIVNSDGVIAATGINGFSVKQLGYRLRRVQRYSFQRPLAESVRLKPDVFAWRTGGEWLDAAEVGLAVVQDRTLVPRNINNYTFPVAEIKEKYAVGTVRTDVKPDWYHKDRSLKDVIDPPNKTPEGFTEAQLEQHLTDDLQELRNVTLNCVNLPYDGKTVLEEKQFEILSLASEKTGFLFADISCLKGGTLYILFDEILKDGDVDPLRMECCNVIRIDAQKGDYAFQSFEPFGMMHIKLVCVSGSFEIRNLGMREFICPQPVTASLKSDDSKLLAIYDAARETFLQNSTDIFMDCPTRERAGWLCDSFFTSRAEKYFTGENRIERNFLENYLLPEKFRDVPEGMVPMCYPSDHWDNQFIPNWAMWLIAEIKDYGIRTGDTELIAAFKDRVYGILNFLAKYENSDGLLEKLPGWVFVEWSRANHLVQDINFPSNMLYAYVLEKAGEMYSDSSLIRKAQDLKAVIRARSFTGKFFCDNEVYEGDTPVLSGEITETCQYYAFFTGVATKELYPELWRILAEDFGPDRTSYSEIHPSNAFIGNYLRLSLLCDNGCYDQMLEEIKGYFYYMAERTGTVWENQHDRASCNHGFASYVAVLIDEALKNK